MTALVIAVVVERHRTDSVVVEKWVVTQNVAATRLVVAKGHED